MRLIVIFLFQLFSGSIIACIASPTTVCSPTNSLLVCLFFNSLLILLSILLFRGGCKGRRQMWMDGELREIGVHNVNFTNDRSSKESFCSNSGNMCKAGLAFRVDSWVTMVDREMRKAPLTQAKGRKNSLLF